MMQLGCWGSKATKAVRYFGHGISSSTVQKFWVSPCGAPLGSPSSAPVSDGLQAGPDKVHTEP